MGIRFSEVMNSPTQPANAIGSVITSYPLGIGPRIQWRETETTGIAEDVTRRLSAVPVCEWCKPITRKMSVGTKSRQGPADADVEQGSAAAHPRLHGDHRSKCAERREGHGNEVRQTGVHAIPMGLKEMAHLVAQQDRHHRHRVAKARQRRQPSDLPRVAKPHRPKRAQARGDEQQQGQQPAAARPHGAEPRATPTAPRATLPQVRPGRSRARIRHLHSLRLSIFCILACRDDGKAGLPRTPAELHTDDLLIVGRQLKQCTFGPMSHSWA